MDDVIIRRLKNTHDSLFENLNNYHEKIKFAIETNPKKVPRYSTFIGEWYNSFFFNKIFFPFKNFYNNTKKTFKSNNKNNNYINQLLKLPLLKCVRTHTHTHTHTQNNNSNNNKRQYQPPSPKNRHPYKNPDGGANSNSQGIGAVDCCRKDLHTRGCRDPRSTPFHSYVSAT